MFLSVLHSVLLLLFILIVLVCFFYEGKARISPTPVLPWVRRRALGMVPDRFSCDGVYRIADLGCGWGAFISALARRFRVADITGYEISPFPYAVSFVKSLFLGRRVRVVRRSFFDDDLSGYDLVMCYLSPYHMEALKPQLLGLKPGSAVVSCSFAIPGWEPVRTEEVWSLFVKVPVYMYEIK